MHMKCWADAKKKNTRKWGWSSSLSRFSEWMRCPLFYKPTTTKKRRKLKKKWQQEILVTRSISCVSGVSLTVPRIQHSIKHKHTHKKKKHMHTQHPLQLENRVGWQLQATTVKEKTEKTNEKKGKKKNEWVKYIAVVKKQCSLFSSLFQFSKKGEGETTTREKKRRYI